MQRRSLPDRRTHPRRTEVADTVRPHPRKLHHRSLRHLLHFDDHSAKLLMKTHLGMFLVYEAVGLGFLLLSSSDTISAFSWIIVGVVPLVHSFTLFALSIRDLTAHHPSLAGARLASACIIGCIGLIFALTSFGLSLTMTKLSLDTISSLLV